MSSYKKVASFVNYHFNEQTNGVFSSHQKAKRHIAIIKVALGICCFSIGLLITGTVLTLMLSLITLHTMPVLTLTLSFILTCVIGAWCYYFLYDKVLSHTEQMVSNVIHSTVSIVDIEPDLDRIILYPKQFEYANDIDRTNKTAKIETIMLLLDW